MRRIIGRPLRKRFRDTMKSRLPGFQEDPTASAQLPQGWTCFRLRTCSHLHFWLLLVMPRDDWFTIECAWSTEPLFPSNETLSHPIRDLPLGRKAMWCRAGPLWQNNDAMFELASFDHDGFTTLLVEGKIEKALEQAIEGPQVADALARIEPLVQDAFDKIERFVLPYFDRVAEMHGCTERLGDVARKPADVA